MQDPIDMGNNFITNVKDPLSSNSHYAATVNFVNKTVSDNNATISALIDSKIDEVEDLNIKLHQSYYQSMQIGRSHV